MTYIEYFNDLTGAISRAIIKINYASNELSKQGNGFIDTSFINEVLKRQKDWQELQNEFHTSLIMAKEQGKKGLDEIIPNNSGLIIKYVIMKFNPAAGIDEWIYNVGYGGYFELRKEADEVCKEMNLNNNGEYYVEARPITY